MTGREIARRAGISAQRVSQLLARGETAASILSGAYDRSQPPAPRCDECGKLASAGHRRGCSRGGHHCGVCGMRGHNRATCEAGRG